MLPLIAFKPYINFDGNANILVLLSKISFEKANSHGLVSLLWINVQQVHAQLDDKTFVARARVAKKRKSAQREAPR